MDTKALDVPEADGADVAHIAATTILSAVPFLGAGDLLKFIVTPSLEKRRDKWMQTVVDTIREIQECKTFSIDDLRDKEEFVTLLIQATQIAYKTHQEAKLQLIKTSLINSIITATDFDDKQLFFRILDNITTTHIDILKLVKRNYKQTRGIVFAQYCLEKMIKQQEPVALALKPTLFYALLEDLRQLNLIITSSDFIIMDGDVERTTQMEYNDGESSTLPHMTISGLAYNFLKFITD